MSSTGGFAVHVTPVPYTAHVEWPLVTAVRGAHRVMAGNIAGSGHRSLSRSCASRRLPTGTEIAPFAGRGLRLVPKTVVAYHDNRRSRWAECSVRPGTWNRIGRWTNGGPEAS